MGAKPVTLRPSKCFCLPSIAEHARPGFSLHGFVPDKETASAPQRAEAVVLHRGREGLMLHPAFRNTARFRDPAHFRNTARNAASRSARPNANSRADGRAIPRSSGDYSPTPMIGPDAWYQDGAIALPIGCPPRPSLALIPLPSCLIDKMAASILHLLDADRQVGAKGTNGAPVDRQG